MKPLKRGIRSAMPTIVLPRPDDDRDECEEPKMPRVPTVLAEKKQFALANSTLCSNRKKDEQHLPPAAMKCASAWQRWACVVAVLCGLLTTFPIPSTPTHVSAHPMSTTMPTHGHLAEGNDPYPPPPDGLF